MSNAPVSLCVTVVSMVVVEDKSVKSVQTNGMMEEEMPSGPIIAVGRGSEGSVA